MIRTVALEYDTYIDSKCKTTYEPPRCILLYRGGTCEIKFAKTFELVGIVPTRSPDVSVNKQGIFWGWILISSQGHP